MTTIQRISLNTADFTKCLHQYIENEKPDPIQKKQLESWKIIWTNNNTTSDDDDNDDATIRQAISNDGNDDAAEIITKKFIPTHKLSGVLQISTEYMILSVYTKCIWMGDILNGSIRFTYYVSVDPKEESSVIAAPPAAAATTTNKKKKDTSTTRRLSMTMIDRLCNDDYIRKILTLSSNTKSDNVDTKQNRYLFCSASMDTKTTTSTTSTSNKTTTTTSTSTTTNNNKMNDTENEERVYCDENIGEAIRRTIYSTSDSILDIIDILFRLPYLPCTDTSSSSDDGNVDTTTTTTTTTTKLADRIRLRLLEEATYDVCYNEPDDEIVDDLSIQENNRDDDDDDDTKDTKISQQKSKKVKR